MNNPAGDDLDRADMQRLAAGHDAALNHLIERHVHRLFAYLLRQLNDEYKANDIAQETFAKVYIHRAKFRGDGKFSTWLYTIATNLLREHFRWKSRHPEVSLEAHAEEHQSLGEILSDNSSSPDETLMQQERAEQVRCAVQALPEDLRTPLILSEYEDLSQEEIATILNCTRKAVEMRIYRARTELRKTLTDFVAELK
jgi:RNA polymerase sigma-70 factor (ECF subfamily)